ncbi:hypothetical protein TW95_gp1825 [Pandoravirus inopinatum]|uniref:Uncharacterized protein n=1 Tax=Pandoravirus inopinatum TaxID=1605721 RepID=A0A0B5J4K2_9VIRU|nr:hypothetical protein TW95_gp1825 [Pandoravirus inopinatum]AJF98559.1 hypothetical protein [Pandoravirus inopinatum]
MATSPRCCICAGESDWGGWAQRPAAVTTSGRTNGARLFLVGRSVAVPISISIIHGHCRRRAFFPPSFFPRLFSILFMWQMGAQKVDGRRLYVGGLWLRLFSLCRSLWCCGLFVAGPAFFVLWPITACWPMAQ